MSTKSNDDKLITPNQKRRGRPAIGPVLSVRIDRSYVEALDEWRDADPDKPSRSEALRFMIAMGIVAAYDEKKK
jgi:hypothetical protein